MHPPKQTISVLVAQAQRKYRMHPQNPSCSWGPASPSILLTQARTCRLRQSSIPLPLPHQTTRPGRRSMRLSSPHSLNTAHPPSLSSSLAHRSSRVSRRKAVVSELICHAPYLQHQLLNRRPKSNLDPHRYCSTVVHARLALIGVDCTSVAHEKDIQRV